MSKTKFHITSELLKKKYLVEKLSTVEIAKNLGCSISNVFHWMKKFDIKRRTKGEAQKGKKNPMYGKILSEETRKKLSERRKGRKASLETRKKQSLALKGKYTGEKSFNWKRSVSKETREKLSRLKKGKKRPELSGKNHPNWRGGITPENSKIRNSIEAKLWREAVFKRDNYTCIWCGDTKGGNLEADHIQKWSEYPELRFAVDNGRTLCSDCHKKRHRKYGQN